VNTRQWYVLVEQNGGSAQAPLWQLSHAQPAADFEDALTVAHQVALHHLPKTRMRRFSRSLFRTQDGGWLVLLEGTRLGWFFRVHFRVLVAEYHGTFPQTSSA
jgi:hypothetical protein